MPLSEFYRMAKGKVEPPQQKPTCSTDLSFLPDNEVVELVWENGHIMMQGPSSRGRKNPKIPTSNEFHFQTARFQGKGKGNETIGSIYSDIGETCLSQDDDTVPWLNYPIEDHLQQDYYPDFLHELSGVTVNEPTSQENIASMDKKYRYDQIVRNPNCVSLGQGNESKAPASAQMFPWSLQQGQTMFPSTGSRVSEIISNNTSNLDHDGPGGAFSNMKMQKQDSGLPQSSSSLLNFSHFSRPVVAARDNIQNTSGVSTSASTSMGNIDKVSAASCKIPPESAPLDPNSVLQKKMSFHTQPNLVSTIVDSKPLETKPLEEPRPRERSDAVSQEDDIQRDKPPNQPLGGSSTKGVKDNENFFEPVVASSVCSGNCTERTSNNSTVNLKRKNCRDTEESECLSEDVEEVSVGVKKATCGRVGSGSKRSRAAEVHNLSERRRRDRINKKMRALQELIPNCNKVDKASMLDEAIEYLKTLQLQVQFMSMGAGLYMPTMMFPTGMHHIHPAHIPHFSPMGVGMGGFGMNMLDLNCGSRGSSTIPLQPIHGTHFPFPPISGSTNFQGMVGSNLQVFGHPNLGIPLPVIGAPLVLLPEQPQVNSLTGMNVCRVEASNSAPSMNSKDLTVNTNSPKVMHYGDASSPIDQKSSQLQATNEGFDPALVPKTDVGTDAGSSAANLAKTSDVVPCKAAGRD